MVCLVLHQTKMRMRTQIHLHRLQTRMQMQIRCKPTQMQTLSQIWKLRKIMMPQTQTTEEILLQTAEQTRETRVRNTKNALEASRRVGDVYKRYSLYTPNEFILRSKLDQFPSKASGPNKSSKPFFG